MPVQYRTCRKKRGFSKYVISFCIRPTFYFVLFHHWIMFFTKPTFRHPPNQVPVSMTLPSLALALLCLQRITSSSSALALLSFAETTPTISSERSSSLSYHTGFIWKSTPAVALHRVVFNRIHFKNHIHVLYSVSVPD